MRQIFPEPSPQSHCFAASSSEPRRISSATPEGTTNSEHKREMRSILEILPRRISGEALTTHFLLTGELFGQFLGRDLKRRDLEALQSLQEFLAAHACQFRGL